MVYLLIAPIIPVVVVVFGLAVLSGAVALIAVAGAVALVLTLLIFNPPVGIAVLALAWIGAMLHRRNRRERRAGHRPILAPAATGSSPKDREGRRRWGGSDGVCGRIPSRAPRLRLPLVWRCRLQRDIAVPKEIVALHAGFEETLAEELRQGFLPLAKREPGGLGEQGREDGDQGERAVGDGLAGQDIAERLRDGVDLGERGHGVHLHGAEATAPL